MKRRRKKRGKRKRMRSSRRKQGMSIEGERPLKGGPHHLRWGRGGNARLEFCMLQHLTQHVALLLDPVEHSLPQGLQPCALNQTIGRLQSCRMQGGSLSFDPTVLASLYGLIVTKSTCRLARA